MASSWGHGRRKFPLLLTRHDVSATTLGLLILALGRWARSAAMLFAGRLIQRYGSRSIARAFGLATAPSLAAGRARAKSVAAYPAMALMGALIGSHGCVDERQCSRGRTSDGPRHDVLQPRILEPWRLHRWLRGSYVILHWGAEAQALIVACIAFATVLLASPRLIADAPHTSAEKPVPHALFPRDPALWLLGVMALICMVPEGAVLDWAAIYLVRELGADLFRAGLGFAGFAAAMAVMRFAGDRLRNRFGAVKTLQISGLISAAGLMGGGCRPE